MTLELKAKLLAIAASLLDDAADEFSNHGCNDWKWPNDITPEERHEAARMIVASNVMNRPFTADDHEEVRHLASDYGVADWQMMRFLTRWLVTLPAELAEAWQEIERLKAELDEIKE